MKDGNNWFNFLKMNRGKQLSMKELSVVYRTLQSTLLHDNMTFKELCAFATRVTKCLETSTIHLSNLIGTGSYGLIVGIDYKPLDTLCIMKISRICTIKLPPVRFPVMNNNRTSWHCITKTDFSRGVNNQTKLYNQLLNIVRIPKIHMNRIVTLNECQFGCIIMEKIRSITLKRCMTLPRLSNPVKHYLIKKAGMMLKRLHLRSIVHADYHAWNILVNQSCHLYLIDYDRSMKSSKPEYQLHDMAMFMDSVESKYWYSFAAGYFGNSTSALPFNFVSDNPVAQKHELHNQSRTLFANYINDLRSGNIESL